MSNARGADIPDGITPDDPASPPKRRLPPAAGQGKKQPPRYIQTQRLAAISRAIVDGLGRPAIMQAVAADQRKEAAARFRARAAGAADEELPHLVPLIWGDIPIPERTIDHYIKRAREAIAEDGKKITKAREFVLGQQLQRLNDVYQKAMAKERFQAALGALREINLMFGLHEAVKIMMTQLLAPPADAVGNVPNLKTDAGRMAAFANLARRAMGADPQLRSIFEQFIPPASMPAANHPEAN